MFAFAAAAIVIAAAVLCYVRWPDDERHKRG
jgi:hypothetical protein